LEERVQQKRPERYNDNRSGEKVRIYRSYLRSCLVATGREEGIKFKVERPTVYCLSMDLIGATEVGLKFTTREFDRFNRQLVEQIKPHLEKLWLADALLKFTGDGWLLMIHEAEKVPALCCLAIIMANRFQDEMSQLTKIVIDRIPPLRLAICSGQDTYVVLADGRKDWVGDSARRATRASGYCFPNEVLIDEPVRYIVFRDFYVKPADVKQRPPKYQPKRMEEDFPVHVLGEPKPEVAADSEAPEYFVYTLSIIGKMKEAEIVAQRVSERLGDEASKLGIAEVAARQGILRSWNRLMASLLDYSSALEMLKSIRDARLVPDVVTYNTLINKAPDYDAAKAWVDTMRGEGIQPSVVTYDTLINKAPDYDAAKAWVDTMRGEGIQPNVITYNTLINKAPDYDAAKAGVDTMRGEGIQPDVVTYNTLINKAPDYDAAKAWVETMYGEGIQPSVVTYDTLIKKAPGYDAAKAWVDTMRGEGIQPNVITYNTLINKAAPDYDAAKAWVDTMRGEGIQPDVITYNTLIKKAPGYDAAKAWVDTMRGEGIQPDVITYNTLIKKAPGYDAAKVWVDMMRGEGTQPDVVTYNTLIKKAPDYDAAKAWVETMRGEGIQPGVVAYNILIKKAPDYDAAKAWVDTMRGKGIQPDIITYTILINKAPDYDAAKAWVDMMRGEGTQPDVVTYTILINKAPDYDAAKAWVETMRGEGIQPGVVAYNILIKKAPDYDAAKAWVEMMRGEGIQPSVVTYSTLFSKDLSGKPADEILEWYLAQEYQPEEPIQTAIAAYRKIHRIDQALRLALDYPHLQTARKLMRKHEEEALSYFKTISDHDPEHPNAEYALGIALMELGRELEAQPHLRKALKLAKEGPRKVVIKEWLRQIDRKLAQKQSVADS
jgi:class 3 adenylate cyclase